MITTLVPRLPNLIQLGIRPTSIHWRVFFKYLHHWGRHCPTLRRVIWSDVEHGHRVFTRIGHSWGMIKGPADNPLVVVLPPIQPARHRPALQGYFLSDFDPADRHSVRVDLDCISQIDDDYIVTLRDANAIESHLDPIERRHHFPNDNDGWEWPVDLSLFTDTLVSKGHRLAFELGRSEEYGVAQMLEDVLHERRAS